MFMSWSVVVFFFFKQKTAYEMRISDWSSDVCSSDLIIARWRAASGQGRASALADLLSVFRTGKGEPRKCSPKLMDAEPDYEALSARLGECCDNLLKLRARVLWADLYAQALSAGRAYARAYGEATRLAGRAE